MEKDSNNKMRKLNDAEEGKEMVKIGWKVIEIVLKDEEHWIMDE